MTRRTSKRLFQLSWLLALYFSVGSGACYGAGNPTSLTIPTTHPETPEAAPPLLPPIGVPNSPFPYSGTTSPTAGGQQASDGTGNQLPIAPNQQILSPPSGSSTLHGMVTEEQALNNTLLTGPRAEWMRRQLGVARAGVTQAKILPNPAIEFDNGYAEFSYRVGVAIPIEPPWKLFLRLIAAKANVGTTELQMEQALWLLRADTRKAYTELVIAEEAAVMMRNLANLNHDLADVAAKRYNAGDVAKLDMFKADLAYQQADIDASQAERRIIQAREQLNIIMGRNENTALAVPPLTAFQVKERNNELLPDLAKPLPPLAQYVDTATKDRLEIKIVRQEIVATQAGRKLAKGNIWPNGQLAFGYDRQLNFAPEPNLNRLYLMGSFPLPVFDRQQGELARIRATLDQLNAELAAQQNIVRGQVALAYRKVLNARENIRKYQGVVLAQSEKVSDLGRLSYRLGQTDITSALNAQQANIQVRNLYLNEVLAYQLAFTDLEQAIGHILR